MSLNSNELFYDSSFVAKNAPILNGILFSSGVLHFYTERGVLVFIEQFTRAPAVSIRLGQGLHNTQDLVVLFRDCLVVIEGLTLYTALRSCRSQVGDYYNDFLFFYHNMIVHLLLVLINQNITEAFAQFKNELCICSVVTLSLCHHIVINTLSFYFCFRWREAMRAWRHCQIWSSSISASFVCRT